MLMPSRITPPKQVGRWTREPGRWSVAWTPRSRPQGNGGVQEPRLISPQGDFSHGGGLAREAVTAQLRWSVQMLDSRCPEAVRGELHTAVADLAGVAAWMSFDGLAHNDSRRLFRVAVGCLG